MKHTQLFLLILISSFVIFSCKKDESNEKPKEDIPIKIALLTKDVNNITKNAAESGVTIQVTGAGNIDEVGICWSTNNLPTINDAKSSGSETSTAYNNSSKTFELNILNLDSNTNYFVRAYAKYKDSVYYGNEQSFKTLENQVSENGYWVFDNKSITDLLYVNYNIPENSIVLIEINTINVGSIEFNGGLQAPLEYSVKNYGDSLSTLQTSIVVFMESVQWVSVEGDFLIKTSLENGKIKVEFNDVEMKNVVDNTIVKTSASFFVEL